MRQSYFQRIMSYVILSLLALLFVIPLLWILLASFDEKATQVLKLPANVFFGNYETILGDVRNQSAFKNGLILSGGQTILVVLLSIIAAYPLSRFRLPNKQKFMMGILFMTSLPMTAVMVPVYQMFIMFGFIDSLLATMFFLTASQLPFGIWMMKNFMDSVSPELEEAAWIDGSSRFEGIRRVILPLMTPGVFTVAIFTFIGSWGNFFVPYILLSSPNKLPASVTLYQFFGQYGYAAYGQLAAYSVIYMMPTFILYYFAQNHMSKGFTMGGSAKG